MLPGPLRHAVKISVVQVDPAATPKPHPQLREPTDRPVYKAAVVLTAQLALGSTEAFRQRPGGDDPVSDGHVTLRHVDVAREAPAGFRFHKGDRITTLYTGTANEQLVNFVVERFEQRGHHAGVGPTLWMLFYRDMKTQAQAV